MGAVERSNSNNNSKLYIYNFFDVNTLLNKNTTLLIRVKKNNYANMFIYKGDIITVDTDMQPLDNTRVIVSMSGFLSIKVFRIINGQNFIQSERYRFMPLSVGEIQFNVVGMITGIIHNYADSYI